jgi:hypothetical protein
MAIIVLSLVGKDDVDPSDGIVYLLNFPELQSRSRTLLAATISSSARCRDHISSQRRRHIYKQTLLVSWFALANPERKAVWSPFEKYGILYRSIRSSLFARETISSTMHAVSR